jgi:hypothetical protein
MKSTPLLFAALLVPLLLAPHAAQGQTAACSNPPNAAYAPRQALHTFFGTGGAGGVNVFDTSGCPTGDGDNDFGIGGGAFPQGPGTGSACELPNGHHGFGQDAPYVATNFVLPMRYAVGTDGQIGVPDALPTPPCTGNGIISDDYVTDPFDCYQGQAGDTTSQPARLGHNVWDGTWSDPWSAYGAISAGGFHADPNGGDCVDVNGQAWVFLEAGGAPISVPTLGAITG